MVVIRIGHYPFMLVAKATEHLRRSLTLFGRRCLVVQKNLVDDRVERTKFWCEAISGRWVGLGMFENLPDGSNFDPLTLTTPQDLG
jgi:hypothetical protein